MANPQFAKMTDADRGFGCNSHSYPGRDIPFSGHKPCIYKNIKWAFRQGPLPWQLQAATADPDGWHEADF